MVANPFLTNSGTSCLNIFQTKQQSMTEDIVLSQKTMMSLKICPHLKQIYIGNVRKLPRIKKL